MPMLMVPSASLLTHSWEAVYFRFAGLLMIVSLKKLN
jgi:hypothetical protein